MDELKEFLFYLKNKEISAKTNKGFFNEKSKNYEHWNDWEYTYNKMQSVLISYMNQRQDFLKIYGAKQ